jgi:hypothetical protein
MWAFTQKREPSCSPGSKSTPGKNPFPKRESQKINPESVKYFQPQNTTINSPRNHHNPPQIHHQKPRPKHPISPKPPAKTQKTFPQKKRFLAEIRRRIFTEVLGPNGE